MILKQTDYFVTLKKKGDKNVSLFSNLIQGIALRSTTFPTLTLYVVKTTSTVSISGI